MVRLVQTTLAAAKTLQTDEVDVLHARQTDRRWATHARHSFLAGRLEVS